VAYQISRRSFLMGEEGPWVTLKRSELRNVLVRAHECLSEPSIWHTELEYAVKHAKEAPRYATGRRRYVSTSVAEACCRRSSACHRRLRLRPCISRS
jgi:hypothetical protein